MKWEPKCCRRLGAQVVTSIFPPSAATRKLGEMTRQGWCYVVVADKNGPKAWDPWGRDMLNSRG